jgi:hypothetical protein
MCKGKYNLNLRDEQSSHVIEIEAHDDDDAINIANDTVQGEADEWCSNGSWGAHGASVCVWWTLTDNDGKELDRGSVTVEIEPDYPMLIKDAVGSRPPEDFCGYEDDDHEWTSEGLGGCDSNPGVWSTGGTSMVFKTHCKNCGLRRTEYHTGLQRNPGEHDTVEYEMPEDDDE